MALKVPTARHLDADKGELFIETIRQRLASHSPILISKEGGGFRHASVLIPLLQEQEIWKIVLTRRSQQVAHHKGQISFPGGRVDRGDRSHEETALRETFEEIGLKKGQVEILGRIDDIQTVASKFIVHPFVGHIFPDPGFLLNTREVDSVIKIPLHVFLLAGSHRGQYSVTYRGKTYETDAYRYHGDLIWGATAGMIKNLADVIGYKIGLLRGEK